MLGERKGGEDLLDEAKKPKNLSKEGF